MLNKETFEGSSLLGILQHFWKNRISGVLTFAQDPDWGLLFVRNGRLIDAFVVLQHNTKQVVYGEQAVLLILTLEHGQLSFVADPLVSHQETIPHGCEWLLETADEEPLELEISTALVNQSNELELASPENEHSFTLSFEDWSLLVYISNYRSLPLNSSNDEANLIIVQRAIDLFQRGFIRVAPYDSSGKSIAPQALSTYAAQKLPNRSNFVTLAGFVQILYYQLAMFYASL